MGDQRLEFERATGDRFEGGAPIIIVAIYTEPGVPGAKQLDLATHQLRDQCRGQSHIGGRIAKHDHTSGTTHRAQRGQHGRRHPSGLKSHMRATSTGRGFDHFG